MHNTLRRDVVKPSCNVLQNNTIQSIPDSVVSLTTGSDCSRKQGCLKRECPIGHSADFSDTHLAGPKRCRRPHLASTALGAVHFSLLPEAVSSTSGTTLDSDATEVTPRSELQRSATDRRHEVNRQTDQQLVRRQLRCQR